MKFVYISGMVVVAILISVGIWYGLDILHRDTIKRIEAHAKTNLQFYLDQTTTPGLTKVDDVAVIPHGQDEYTGEALVHVLQDHLLVLSVSVISDRQTTVVHLDDKEELKIRASIDDELQSIKTQDGKAVLQSRFLPLFPDELKKDIAKFQDRLSAADNIQETDDFFFGSGCKMGSCSDDQAAWTISKTTGHLTALITHTSYGRSNSGRIDIQADLYGRPAGRKDMPAPLESWLAGQKQLIEISQQVIADSDASGRKPAPQN
jgi:hypothetical protein